MEQKKVLISILLLFSTVILYSGFASSQEASAESKIIANPTVQVLLPNDTIMAVCSPSEKYWLEPGDTLKVKLYIRNDMDDKIIKRVYLDVWADGRFKTSFSPAYLENIETKSGNDVQFFLVNFTAPDDMPTGNYRVDFQVGTDEYDLGSYHDEIMIKVRPYGNEIYSFFAIIIIIILIAIIVRFFWIRRANKIESLKHRKEKHKKTPSQTYYQKKKPIKKKKR